MKKIIIVLLVILIVFIGYNYYKNNYLLPDYLKNTKRKEVPTFNSEEERLEYVKKFAESGNIVNDESDLNTNNVGGYEGVLIDTSQIVDIVGLDVILKLDEDLTTRLNLLSALIKDLEKYKTKEELITYYKKNKYDLIKLYGISDIENLIEIKEKLKNAINKEFVSAKITNPDKKGNIVTFNLETINNKNENYKFDIKLILLKENEKLTILYYWR